VKRTVTGGALACSALVLLLPPSAVAGLGFTVQEGFASPTVELGSAKASTLCDIGMEETRYVPPPVGVAYAALLAPPPRPCREQPGVRPLVVARARIARVTLQAPADRLIPAWYRNGRLEPLTATRTGRLTWRVTVPATSGRLLLGLEFDLDDGQAVCCTREMRLDWKLSIRRRPARPAPAPPPTLPPVVPIDATPPAEYDDRG
jgi:hypothetical protein